MNQYARPQLQTQQSKEQHSPQQKQQQQQQQQQEIPQRMAYIAKAWINRSRRTTYHVIYLMVIFFLTCSRLSYNTRCGLDASKQIGNADAPRQARQRPNNDEIVHIFRTRFMQFQYNLTTLGLARLQLLEAFTLPSLEAQTNRNFLWFIRTDPRLVDEIKQPLMDALRRSSIRDRIILLGDNENPTILRNSTQNATLLLGNSNLLRRYIERSAKVSTPTPPVAFNTSDATTNRRRATALATKKYVVLDTWLDADDALPRNFVEFIQSEARMHIDQRPLQEKEWILWCNHDQYEWHAIHPALMDHNWTSTKAGKQTKAGKYTSQQQQQQQPLQQHVDSTFGFLKRRRVDVCITPGLTVAYDTSCEKEDLPPTLRHTKLDTTFVACTGENHYRAKCLHRMYDDDQAASLRARTLTSTGMKDVVVPVIDLLKPSTAKKKKKQRKETKQQTQQRRPDDQDQLWEQMEQEFGVSKQFMSATRRMLLEQTTDIAAENLLGQCTKDHSCKSKAQEQLKSVANGGA